MRYAVHASKVVVGATIAFVAYGLAVDVLAAAVQLFYSLILLVGLFVAVHGLFSGVEAAIAAGVDGER